MSDPTWEDTVPSWDETLEPPPKKKGLIRGGWQALAWPEQKSREGLKMISEAIPEQPIQSRSATLNFIGGVPRVAAETLGEAAPGFVSRSAMLMSGAGPAIKAAGKPLAAIGRGLGKQLESASGIAPKAEGALAAVYKDPSILLEKGREAAGKIYGAAKSAAGVSDDLTNQLMSHQQVIEKAATMLGEGALNPSAAQTARKSVDALMSSKQYPRETLIKFRDMFDKVAKSNKNLSEADRLFQRSVYADAIRHLLPQNKYGGASAFKTLLLMASPTKVGSAVTLPLLSPIMQGAGAAALGMGSRALQSPGLRGTIGAGLSILRDRRKK